MEKSEIEIKVDLFHRCRKLNPEKFYYIALKKRKKEKKRRKIHSIKYPYNIGYRHRIQV